MKTVKIKKRYRDMAEVRSYVWDEAKLKKVGIKFLFIDAYGKELDSMSVPYEELNRGIVTAKGIKSKIVKGQVFDLISFLWISDKDKENESPKETQMTIFDVIT